MYNHDWSDKVILIAEDEKINFLFLKAVFAKTGATVLWAKDGKETLDICLDNKQQVDIILMDLQMPHIGGLEATRTIKDTCPSICVIVQTAHSFDEDREKALEAGCDDFLAKPIRPLNLLATVEKFIS